MKENPIRILLIEDNKGDVILLKDDLKGNHIQQVSLLKDAFPVLQQEEFDIILLDLNLPDSNGLSTVKRLMEGLRKGTPIIVMTGNDEDIGVQAVQLGAEDYLVKGYIEPSMLTRSIKHSIERNKLRKQLLEMSIFDDLTGLYNRRGFKILAEQKIKEVRRTKQAVVLFLIDLDQMKRINDQLGHLAGDRALIDSAKLIKKSFREADIVSRWGGDEFVVFAVNASLDYVPSIKKRLESNLNEYNLNNTNEFKLSMSVGDVIKDCNGQITLDELIREADKKMYEDKKGTQC